MRDEHWRFTFVGGAVGAVLGLATGGVVDGYDGGRLGSVVGMVGGASLGLWVILAIEDSQ